MSERFDGRNGYHGKSSGDGKLIMPRGASPTVPVSAILDGPGLTAFRVGSMVGLIVGDEKVADAMVTAFTVRAGGVSTYEVVWWSAGDRKTAWVEPAEVEGDPADRRGIGFRAHVREATG